jgi:chemotaxis protein methyltransferase CheR
MARSLTNGEIRPLTSREFSLFKSLVENETGIFLSEVKQALVNARLLSRIRELGVTTFSDYYDRVVKSPEDELVRLIDAICTNETQFFREPAQFELLRASLIPRWISEGEHGLRPRRLRIWSAACSTGEEPYSLAMLLLDRLPADWSIEVVATDLSTKALARAIAGIYPMARLADVPPELRQRYLLRGVGEQDGKFCVGAAVRRLVDFSRVNLIADRPLALGSFDLVLCRNVLMYFRPETRLEVVARLTARLNPNGHLLVGHSESLHGVAGLRTVIPTVYQLLEDVA